VNRQEKVVLSGKNDENGGLSIDATRIRIFSGLFRVTPYQLDHRPQFIVDLNANIACIRPVHLQQVIQPQDKNSQLVSRRLQAGV
jgi:hypothetical protein